jgi:hypothetical protein
MEKRADYNVGVNISKMVDELPAGLDRAMLRVLTFHVGRSTAISRSDLVKALKAHGFAVHERAARVMINQMRKEGYPICSTGGEEGGYWLASGWNELNEYIDHEIHSRAMDLLEQEGALREMGKKTWGEYSPGKQYQLDI